MSPVGINHLLRWILCGAVAGLVSAADLSQRGARVYRQQCVGCHGAQGEGVAGKYDESLTGEKSVDALASYIQRTMPEDDPGSLSSKDALAVATHVHGAFYSPEARARLNPVRLDFQRLTHRQYQESVADLLAGFGKITQAKTPGGLKADYFQSKGMNKKDTNVLQRQDALVDFDFGTNTPAKGITADQFSIAWSGSLLAPESGTYEFRISTPNGARLYLNTDFAAGDSNRRDDSDAKRQTALVDLWVSSGGMMREGIGSISLLGGRSYPLRVDYFKFKEATASVRLEWRPPNGSWTLVPSEALSPEPSSSWVVIGTAFPPDDSSQGYERGTSISKGWNEGVAKAAVEIASVVEGRLGSLAKAGEGATNRIEKLREFSLQLAERAFRRPLTPEQVASVIDRSFTAGIAPETAIKRAVIRIFTSPSFLYPELDGANDPHAIAARLALALWDSVPDEPLRLAAAEGRLSSPELVREQATRMLTDPRAHAKLQGFFHHWLKLEEASDLSKDPKAYPGFDDRLIADLRWSLEKFLDHVVWSDSSDYRELLRADYLFLNDRLARFYGMDVPAEPGFARVRFDPAQRAGVLTHPLLLAAFSYHRSSSPIHRGVFLTRNVLGRALKPPPMAIEFMDDRFDPLLTMREKVTELTRKPTCMGCHSTINPLGFSLENFDAAGRFRTVDNARPVDSTADYTAPDGQVLRLTGPRDIAEHAATSPEARRGFIRQLFQHTSKQNPAAYGPDTLTRLDKTFVRDEHHVRQLWIEMATLVARHTEPAPPAVPAPAPARKVSIFKRIFR